VQLSLSEGRREGGGGGGGGGARTVLPESMYASLIRVCSLPVWFFFSPLWCCICCSGVEVVFRVLLGVAEWCRVVQFVEVDCYGVATVSRIDKIIGLFCKISSLL